MVRHYHEPIEEEWMKLLCPVNCQNNLIGIRGIPEKTQTILRIRRDEHLPLVLKWMPLKCHVPIMMAGYRWPIGYREDDCGSFCCAQTAAVKDVLK